MSTLRFPARSGSMLHVEEHGRGLPILALHGLGGGAWFFSGLGRRLGSGRRVIAIDLPGTGRSVCGGSFSLETWSADLRDLVNDHVRDPVVVLGHSMGTILALEAWRDWPEHIRAMVFVGGLPEPTPAARERLLARAGHVERHGLAGLGAQVSAANFAAATLDRQPELVGLFERAFESQDAGRYAQWCRLLAGSSARAIVHTVRVPCLAITGREDQYAPPALVSAFLRELPQQSRDHVLADCGHLPFLEAPEAFAAAVETFAGTLC